jgi:hypothetical protein
VDDRAKEVARGGGEDIHRASARWLRPDALEYGNARRLEPREESRVVDVAESVHLCDHRTHDSTP